MIFFGEIRKFAVKKNIKNALRYLGLARLIQDILFFGDYYFWLIFYKYVKKNTRIQNKDPKKIPIIIISFNQLFYLRKLIDFVIEHNYKNIVIIDNNSTYKPLLEYFDEIESKVVIHRLSKNYGHMVFWERKEIFEMYSKGYYVVTDADIVPVEECPGDFVEKFKKVLDKNPTINKVGFSLKIDDIPTTNANRQKIIDWESRFWGVKDKEGDYIADIDTTFALYRPGNKLKSMDSFYKAKRINFPYQARHGGWYVDNKDLTEEQTYFYSTCNTSSSWRIDAEGKLKNDRYSN